MDDCIFCKIVKGELPCKKVYEDEDILAFYDINPSAPVHVLIVSKKHSKNLVDEKDTRLLGKIQLVAVQVAKKLNISDAFRLMTNNGKDAGQVVMHLHYHLMGGFKR